MIRHMLKLVWKRKKLNALIMVEIFISFLVLFAVLTMSFHLLQNYHRPLGFEWRNVWNVAIDVKQTSDDNWSADTSTKLATLVHEIEQVPEVAMAAGALYPPYSFGGTKFKIEIAGTPVEIGVNEVTDDFAALMNMKVIEGRFFGPEDDAQQIESVVIDRDLARYAFGESSATGRTFALGENLEVRVVGIVEDYRTSGELSSPGNFLFRRVRLGDAATRPPRNIVVRFDTPVDASFEEQLLARLQNIAPEWSFTIRPLSAMRDASFRLALAPIMIGAVIAGFMILMVALGLIGVLWQNITRRTDELGLRRAVGATSGRIYRQIVFETLIITTFGLIAGILIIVQVPDTLAASDSPFPELVAMFHGVRSIGLAASIATIYILAIACSLYPSWLASRIQPAEAMQYE